MTNTNRRRQLAAECAAELEALRVEYDEKREAVYRNFQDSADQLEKKKESEIEKVEQVKNAT